MFLNTECDRYLADDEITDEEMHHLKIEFDKFIAGAKESELPLDLKTKIDELKLDFEYKAKREYGDLLGRFNFGSARRKLKQKNQVEELQYQIKGLPTYIKMNFEF